MLKFVLLHEGSSLTFCLQSAVLLSGCCPTWPAGRHRVGGRGCPGPRAFLSHFSKRTCLYWHIPFAVAGADALLLRDKSMAIGLASYSVSLSCCYDGVNPAPLLTLRQLLIVDNMQLRQQI